MATGEVEKIKTAPAPGQGVGDADETIKLILEQQFLTSAFKFVILGDRSFPPLSDTERFEVKKEKYPPEYELTIKNSVLVEKTYYYPINKTSITAILVQEDPVNKIVKLKFMLPADLKPEPITSVVEDVISLQFK